MLLFKPITDSAVEEKSPTSWAGEEPGSSRACGCLRAEENLDPDSQEEGCWMDLCRKKMGPKGEAEQPNSGESRDQSGPGGLNGKNSWGSVLRPAPPG